MKLILRAASFLLSRGLDLLPLGFKGKVTHLFPSKIANSIIRHGSSRNIPWETPFGSFELRVSPSDDFYGMYLQGELTRWEIESLSYWFRFSRDTDTVIDVGSYIGAYALVAASSGGASKVIAFEPNPEGVIATTLNAKRNNLESSIHTYRIALGAKDGVAPLIAPRGRRFSSSATLSSNLVTLQHDWEVTNYVICKPLDYVLNFPHLGTVSMIKIDTEGSEIEVLVGAAKILQLHHPRLIIECLSKKAYDEVFAHLSHFGYAYAIALDGCHYDCQECFKPLCQMKARNFAFEYSPDALL